MNAARRRNGAVQRLGRYELLTELGRGGMAELYLGHLVGVGGFTKAVAIKLMLPHISQDAQYVEMFLHEGRVAAQLSHPNVCQVYELGEEDGQLYLAMEYLSGVSWETLGELLPDDPGQLARIVSGVLGQACDGLQYAHEQNVIHRDVSPQNLFVTVDGVCKVLDFGVAKLMTDGPRTHTGVIKGKLPYMAPEQLAGDPVDARADVFSIGVVLWEALTGERLFSRTTDFQIWNAVLRDPIPLVSAKQPALDGELDRIVMRALERDREQRYPTIRELADDLRRAAPPATTQELAELVRTRCAEHLAERERDVASALAAVRGREPSAGDTVEPASATMSMELRGQSVAIARKPKRRWPLALAALVGVAAVAVVVLARRDGSDAPPKVADAPHPPVDAAPPADAAIDAAPPPADAHPAPHHVRVEPASTEPGMLSIDSDPYAQICIDGVRRPGEDQTPLFRIKLSPGHHVIRAVLADQRSKRFDITIAPGKEVNLHKLTW